MLTKIMNMDKEIKKKERGRRGVERKLRNERVKSKK